MCPPMWEAVGGGCMVAHEAASARPGVTRLVIVGHSLGGAVACQVAHHLHSDILPRLNERRPTGEIAGVLTLAAQLRGAQEVVGAGDAVVPPDSAQVLFDRAAAPAGVWIVPAGHDLYQAKAQVVARTTDWLA